MPQEERSQVDSNKLAVEIERSIYMWAGHKVLLLGEKRTQTCPAPARLTHTHPQIIHFSPLSSFYPLSPSLESTANPPTQNLTSTSTTTFTG